MKITFYNSTAYQKTTTLETDYISGNLPPEDMTEEDRNGFREEGWQTMCNFTDKQGTWRSVPWDFVISIE